MSESTKLTSMRVMSKVPLITPGTGKNKGLEIYPATPTLLHRLGYPQTFETKLKELQTVTIPVEQQRQFKVEASDLRDYQFEDVLTLLNKKAMGCFNEQRTGKTPTSLVTMKLKGVKKLLVIAPASTLYTWAKEARRWYSDTAPIVIADGSASKREQLITNWTTGVLIISYECLRQRVTYNKDTVGNVLSVDINGDIDLIKRHKDIDGCILDEAHRIKNHKSKQAEAVFSLSYIPHRLALTGTPAPGKQHEIYSILHWLYPTIFTGYWRFIDYYFNKYEEYTAVGSYNNIGTFKPGKEKELQEFLNVISTRRLRASVMSWLPEKDRQIITLPQTSSQIKYITDLKETFETESDDVKLDAINVLARLVKFRQILLSPKLVGLKGSSPKITWIKQYLKDYPEKNVIIFSNFTSWLKLLGEELKCNNFIIGETSKKERERLKQEFQSNKIHLLLINIKAGKEGITLDNADVAIFTDKYPPVGDIQQAEDRFVATTKDKINTGHTIIDLVMDNSYEEDILKALKNNESEIDLINNYIKYIKGER